MAESESMTTGEIGATRGEVSRERQTHRNGYRPGTWETRVGELDLLVPRKRSGEAYFPSFLEPRRPAEQAIVSVVMEAYVNGVSTRKVDRLVEQLRISSMSKDRVSALSRGLDERVAVFRNCPLEGEFPYLWLDAKQLKVRSGGHVRSKALVVAYAVHETGRREVIGIDLGEVETEAFWIEVLRGLRARGLQCVRLAVSDHHEGLKTAIARILACPGSAAACTSSATCTATAGEASAGWSPRRCARSLTPKASSRPSCGSARSSIASAPRLPKVAELLEVAEQDLLAFYRFPAAHLSKLRSTNPLERLNKEIGRRSDVVGIFPNDAAAIRLVGAMLIEQNDEWLVCRRYLSRNRSLWSSRTRAMKGRRCPSYKRRETPTRSYTTTGDLTLGASWLALGSLARWRDSSVAAGQSSQETSRTPSAQLRRHKPPGDWKAKGPWISANEPHQIGVSGAPVST
jgi:putative transposase